MMFRFLHTDAHMPKPTRRDTRGHCPDNLRNLRPA